MTQHDTIIVLGGSKASMRKRTEEVYALYKASTTTSSTSAKNISIICSGRCSIWCVDDDRTLESEIMRDYLIELGVPAEHIYLESKSLDTCGNAYFSAQVMNDHNLKNPIVVSSPWHMERVSYIFDKVMGLQGISPQYKGCQADMSEDEMNKKQTSERESIEMINAIIKKLYNKEIKDLDMQDIDNLIQRDLPGYSKAPTITLEEIVELQKT